ncbi:hypothetical protein [Luteimonas sp. e5]
MDTATLTIAVLIVLAAWALFELGRQRDRRRERRWPTRGLTPPSRGLPSPSAAVRERIAAGDRIGAIKLYRQQTGASLRDGHDVIRWHEHHPHASPAPPQEPAEVPPAAASAEPSPEVRRLIAAGERIAAIKLYRQQTGASLRGAHQVIKQHERDPQPLSEAELAQAQPEPEAPASTVPSMQVRSLIAAGQTIAAIKLYRQQTGASLRDARRVILQHSRLLRSG